MLDQIIHNLQRTPKLIDILLTGRNVDELRYKDNDESWNCFDIVRHLIVADETLWIVRAKVFLDDTLEDKTFVPFEPEKTITQYRDLQMEELISILSRKREQNIKEFLELQIHES
ncbi:MAG: hypothetical protein OEY49_17175, partial [Candidatus Heimdallarchaeota archaeon]|nr:hypothetical protein [Candidatus Heimdallarchaeota archaeon]